MSSIPSAPGDVQFGLIVEFQVKPGCLEEFNALIAINAAASVNNEATCSQFDVLHDADDPHHVVLYEIYDDLAAFQNTHMAAEHTKTFLAAAKSFVLSQKAQRLMRYAANSKSKA